MSRRYSPPDIVGLLTRPGPGYAPTPPEYELWTLDTIDVPFTALNQTKPFFTGPGPLLEAIFIEADVNNSDYIAVGGSGMQRVSGGALSQTFAVLHPSQWISIEPEEFTTHGMDGLIIPEDPAAALAVIRLNSRYEVFDASGLYGLSGPTTAGQVLHVTYSLRSRQGFNT